MMVRLLILNNLAYLRLEIHTHAYKVRQINWDFAIPDIWIAGPILFKTLLRQKVDFWESAVIVSLFTFKNARTCLWWAAN
jgi:hypothetical protein